MRIDTTSGVKELIVADDFPLLISGQRSADQRHIYRDATDGSLWCIKQNHPLKEYLGSTAYRALGVLVPDYDIGIETEGPGQGTITYLQKYLPGSSEIGQYILARPADAIPVIIAAAILGDIDVIGRRGDNILLDSSLLFKIDCGKIFEGLRQGMNWLKNGTAYGYNPFFDTLSQQYREDLTLKAQVFAFLNHMPAIEFGSAINIACANFDQLIQKHLRSVFEQIKQRVAPLPDVEVSTIIFLTMPDGKPLALNPTDILNKINLAQKIDALKNLYAPANALDLEQEDSPALESDPPISGPPSSSLQP
jgi:hypothetical protein